MRPRQRVNGLYLTVADLLAPLPIDNNSDKIFQAISNCEKQKRSSQVFREVSGVFQQDFTVQKIVLPSSRGQGNFRGLEASRPRPRTSKCVLEAKDVLVDSTSVTQTSASDPPFYGIFVPLKIPFEKF